MDDRDVLYPVITFDTKWSPLKNRVAFILAFALFVSFICGCGRRSNFDNQVIDQSGTYLLTNGDQIVVNITDDAIVGYRLLDAGHVEQLHSKERASNNQRWQLYWESSNSRLWFNSSDIGTSVWMLKSDGTYEEASLTPETPGLFAQMPGELVAALPVSVQREYMKLPR